MTRHLTPLNGTPRPARKSRSLALYSAPPARRTAAAMDDAAEAERLIEDLLALVDAGLVTPVEGDDGEIRYAPACDEPGDLPAA